ncbi:MULTISPECIES: heavy metal-responsive transcriptional regulator [unclassified Thermosynechococcus]|uniref:heavy metal-responsive transcriptional regulator n=1 Tax=unclassified Thermosynechococcus TaxID=2622553 RepID=UPI002672263B|nr:MULTISPECIES: heavy metal-responsive transcriptional regulator [unclassified Thermosynechococcus]WKT83586.1 heavy metal-responsive transcriptional regulator [Thermosynechococcus sp. HY596]WNC62717.1 heavy metal-responsive transcriptional regulator [Thermosynechococcus sp. HY591]WNC65275.1 heavy metal-responsive transcriptional regulator [Thermosynechococcus sp. HY593]
MNAAAYLIGTVAHSSGLPVKTIRYYEELGLLRTVGRTSGGYRLFAEDVFARLSFIKRAQSLGLTLSDIKALLEVYDRGEIPCDHIKEKLEEKLAAIEAQIQQLQILKQELQGLLSGWRSPAQLPEGTICPILQPVVCS